MWPAEPVGWIPDQQLHTQGHTEDATAALEIAAELDAKKEVVEVGAKATTQLVIGGDSDNELHEWTFV